MTLKNEISAYVDRPRRQEVYDALSYGIWKTVNRILEEIENKRSEQRESKPVDGIITHATQQIWIALHKMENEGLVESRLESQLSETEVAWSMTDEGGRDDASREFKRKRFESTGRGDGELMYYKLVGSSARLIDEEKELVEVSGLVPVRERRW